MQIVLIILSVGLLGTIVYFAVSPKSSRLLKLAALIALGLIAISIGVCSFFLVRGPGETEEVVPFPAFGQAAPPSQRSNAPAVIGFLLVFLLILALMSFIALRSQNNSKSPNRKAEPPRKAAPAPVITDELGLMLSAGKPEDGNVHPQKEEDSLTKEIK